MTKNYGDYQQQGGYSPSGGPNYGQQQSHAGDASSYYGGAPPQSYPQEQGSEYGQQQGSGYDQKPGSGYGQQQGSGYSQQQGSGYGQQQGPGYDQKQGSGYGQQQNFRGEEYDQGPPQYQQYPSTATHSSNSGGNSYNQGYQNQYGGEGEPEGDRGLMGGLAGGAAGAFGGHALGGKAGHGTSGTIIGAVTGAFAGSKAQDWKDERDEKKKWEKQHQQQQNYQQQYPPHHGQDDQRHQSDYGANFTASSRDIRLDAHGDYNLHAQCRRLDGSYQSSTISLNQVIENDNGSFRWSGGHSVGASSYTVQQGDTLRSIAARYNHCTYEELARHNNITNPDMIYPGQNLQVPGGGGRGGGGNFGASARNVRLVDGGQRLEGELSRSGEWHVRSIILDERISNRDGCLEFV